MDDTNVQPLFVSVYCCIGSWHCFLQVERAKKCLDFAFTAYFIHFAACTVYAGFPKQWQW